MRRKLKSPFRLLYFWKQYLLPQVQCFTGNHNYNKSGFDLSIKNINIEDGTWTGAKAIICPGVTCKNHSILTVGSVAIKDLKPYSVYAANPAEKTKDRLPKEIV